MYTQRTGMVSLEGFFLVDSITGIRDTGQSMVEKAATKVGYEAYRRFKIEAVPPSGGVAGTPIGNMTFTGQASISDIAGGGTTDVSPWGAELPFEGKPVGSGIFDIF